MDKVEFAHRLRTGMDEAPTPHASFSVNSYKSGVKIHIFNYFITIYVSEESEEIFKVVLRTAGTDVRYNVREWRHDTLLKYLKNERP